MSSDNKPNAKMRVLLVDDYDLVRMILKRNLVDLGFTRIDDARDGNEALAKLNESIAMNDPFAIIFCDWNMPEKNGLEVLKECRATPALQTVPFVMVTAESEQANIVTALMAGANDYIIKPIAPDVLQKKIAKIMQSVNVA